MKLEDWCWWALDSRNKANVPSVISQSNSDYYNVVTLQMKVVLIKWKNIIIYVQLIINLNLLDYLIISHKRKRPYIRQKQKNGLFKKKMNTIIKIINYLLLENTSQLDLNNLVKNILIILIINKWKSNS